MTQLLQGIRVLDVSRYVAGPMCSALLADLGADVIRVEQPGGADDRTALPLDPAYHGGAGFLQVNRNKRGLTLDISRDRGRAVFDRLLPTADIVVANVPHETLEVLGLSYDRLVSVRSDIILVHITAFGEEGPYADRLGFDGIAQVMCGLTYLGGEPGKPMKSPGAWVDMSTSFIGAFGAMAALRHRDLTGEGQKVSANLFQTALTVNNYFLMEQHLEQKDRAALGNRAPSGAPADLLPTKDGNIFLAVLGNPMFRRFARMIGQQDLSGDPRFSSDGARAAHGELLSEIAAEWSSKLTTAEALAALEGNKLPAGPLLSPQQVLDDPHVRQAMLTELNVDGLLKAVPYVRPPASFSKTPGQIVSGPPAPGQDCDAVLSEVGYTPADIEELRALGLI
jgi:crotonobetainyl-CoA:carnitine CoA-transferase CaiB-like acyl-CoA transferase